MTLDGGAGASGHVVAKGKEEQLADFKPVSKVRLSPPRLGPRFGRAWKLCTLSQNLMEKVLEKLLEKVSGKGFSVLQKW